MGVTRKQNTRSFSEKRIDLQLLNVLEAIAYNRLVIRFLWY